MNKRIFFDLEKKLSTFELVYKKKIRKLKIFFLSIFQYNADTKQTDHEGRTCLTYAKAANSLAIVKQSANQQHHVNSETTKALVELLVSLGITDPVPLTTSGTLPRRQSTSSNGGPNTGAGASNNYEKVPSSVV